MGITPYINASIIMQLMTVVLPQLEEMAKKGGEEGRKKISHYTRWLTIVLAVVQATTMSVAMQRAGVFYDTSMAFLIYAIVAFVAGTLFLMWLGEQISDKGIGNGVSLIIFIGIVLRYPTYVAQTVHARPAKGGVNYLGLLLFIAIALVTIVSIVFMYQGQRRIPVQQARRVVGPQDVRRALELHPAAAEQRRRHLDHLRDLDPAACRSRRSRGSARERRPTAGIWADRFRRTDRRFAVFRPTSARTRSCTTLSYFVLVVVFTFFYSSIVVNTRDIADNLKKSGSFIPGIRPGQPTVDYINRILLRITTVAAVYLGLAGGAAVDAAARPRRHDVLPRLDVAADRRRRRARHDDADRGAPGDARLQGLHQAMSPRRAHALDSFWARPAPERDASASSSRSVSASRQISTGDILREHIADGTELGREAKVYMERGHARSRTI